jgi:hypothetical protein
MSELRSLKSLHFYQRQQDILQYSKNKKLETNTKCNKIPYSFYKNEDKINRWLYLMSNSGNRIYIDNFFCNS